MLNRQSLLCVAVASGILMTASVASAHHEARSDTHATKLAPTPRKRALQPAEGAKVSIVVPAPGAVFTADRVPLHFVLVKGKRGEHVHAYVDGELMGMFKSERGTLTGIPRGPHTLELRVAAKDHRTELDATDRVEFVVE